LGSDVYVQLQQTTSVPTSVSLFKVPLELRLRSATGDTVVRVLNDQNDHIFRFTWGKTMTGMNVDPNAWLTDSVLSITRVTTLNAAMVESGSLKVAPNPATNSWVATGLANAEMILCDVTGKILWTLRQSGNEAVYIPAATLAPGIYLLRVRGEGVEETVVKLIKE
jgi:hypothetical protein